MSESSNAGDTPAAVVEDLEELTEQELSERHRLELKVERAFVEAGVALRLLRDLRLYRSTHRTFEEYCFDRFEYKRARSYQLIGAATVFENLSTISRQTASVNESEKMSTISRQILPTKETQVRPLAKLKPEEQRSVWQRSVEAAGGKVPTERLVKAEVLRHKGIVERLKEKHHISASESYKIGDAFTLTALPWTERKYNGCWAIAIAVNNFTVVVDVHDGILTVKPDNLNPIDSPDVRRQLPQVLLRIRRLRECGMLVSCAYTLLASLGKQTYLTDLEEKLLSYLEEYYRVNPKAPL